MCSKINSIDVLEAAEGDLVVITGLSLNAVTKVYFRLDTFSPTDDVEAPNFAVDSDTQISVRVPADLVAGRVLHNSSCNARQDICALL
jgi:hypothetical protein